MADNLNQNQFSQIPVQGEMDLQFEGSVVSAIVDASSATLIAGQPVKLVDSSSPLPKVTALTANTDVTWGFVSYNPKDGDFPANARLEIALVNSVMWMTAGAAIARGAKLEVVYTTNKVITNAGTNPLVGYAFDKAAADGDLIRVWVLPSAYTVAQTIADIAGLQTALDAETKVAIVTATLAEINAGKVLIAGVTGKKITIVNMTRRVTGSAAVATSADVQSDATSVKVMVDLIAALTNGAVIINKEANATPGAGWAVELPVNEGVAVANIGSAMTTLTSIKYTITYRQAA